jgi:ABC-type tungstate transport system permease subunit
MTLLKYKNYKENLFIILELKDALYNIYINIILFCV